MGMVQKSLQSYLYTAASSWPTVTTRWTHPPLYNGRGGEVCGRWFINEV